MNKQVLVSVDRAETRVALLERPSGSGSSKAGSSTSRASRAKYRVAELYLERRGARSIVGNIYKGRVDNVLAGLEAAFVDIGLDKNGFLHVDEIVLPGVETPRRGRGSGRDSKGITDLLKPGQEIVVQVVKDPLKTKGARLSMELTIAGRYMVYAPTGEGIGVSRRLDDAERARLRREANGLDLGGGGAIIRTAAEGAKRADFERELQYLFKLNEVLRERVDKTSAPALVFQEADLSVRVVRDIASADFERAIVDDAKQHHRLVSFFARTAPELVDRVELYEGKHTLFEEYGVDAVIDGLMSRRIDLPSGGYLMIDYAEALTVIDVNSGSFIGRGRGARLEDTILRTNLEAAEEVVNQLRLRDIGGIIVIDFIDMSRARNRDAVLKTLRNALDEDRTKTFTAEISKLGLVEMTRQNVTEGVREIMTRPCPTCDGEGVIRSEETYAIEFERRLRDIAAAKPKVEAFLVQVNPRVSAQFTGNGSRVLHALEADTGKYFHFEGSEGLSLGHFAITLEGTRAEVEERALPFREGDEVLVQIVEPHMYNVDDAVAKIDGYIISVTAGGGHVGEKRLVRIEEAGRTSAVASLIEDGVSATASKPASRAGASDGARSSRGGSSDGGRRSRGRAKSSSAAKSSSQDESTPAEAKSSAAESEASSADADADAAGSPDAAEDPAPDAAKEPAPAASGDGEGDRVESGRRRRGRRGGRRRSAAGAKSPASE
ncbi:MAG TPA: Rne/Rng family ribonuclease [Solirubrobacteraceae bacterium]|nr:Rne/Rng family ribonuclease [Solirubrobacteraceae bacterium]